MKSSMPVSPGTPVHAICVANDEGLMPQGMLPSVFYKLEIKVMKAPDGTFFFKNLNVGIVHDEPPDKEVACVLNTL